MLQSMRSQRVSHDLVVDQQHLSFRIIKQFIWQTFKNSSWYQLHIGTCQEHLPVTNNNSHWHHWLDQREFEQASGVGDGQGSLVCCSPWGHKELAQLSDWTELNWDLNPTNLGPETMKDLHHCIVLPLMENAHSMVANSKDLWGSEQDMKHISNYWSTVIEWRIVT